MNSHRQQTRRLLFGAVSTILLLVGACGGEQSGSSERSDQSFDPHMETFETFLNSVSYDYAAAGSLEELSKRSTVVTKATLKDVEDGRIFGQSPDDPAASRTLNLVFAAADGATYYVEVPRPADSLVERLREVFPIGQEGVIYLQPNNDPPDNWFNAREDGNQWFFTTPQGWITEMPTGEISVPFVAEGDAALAPPPGGGANLEAWLPQAVPEAG